jgi:pimeloyl-ACP methyl ester carboxylesterase
MSSDSGERNLGYISWKNDLSWMEAQHGNAWDAMVSDENLRFRRSLKGLEPLVKKMESELNSVSNGPEQPYILRGWQIKSVPFTHEKIWTHIRSGFSCKCWDADISEDMFVAAVQLPGGFERFTIEVYSMNDNKPIHLKTIERGGPGVALLDRSVVFLHPEKDLWYSSVCVWSKEKEVTTLYHSSNPKENLELERGEDGTIYMARGDFTKKHYALLSTKHTVKPEWRSSPHLESCIVSDDLRLPYINSIKDTIESFSLKAGWTVTISRGIRTLWKGTEPIVWIWGDISYDPRNPFRLDISDIRYESYTIILPDWKLSNPKPVPFPCSYYDNPLPAFVIHPSKKVEVKGLLVIAYGAYGTPTHAGSLIEKWKSLLLRGWILASVMVPGSGDDTKEWIKEGQRLNRLNAIEMLTKSVKSMQEEFGIGPLNTALYGRSAGGLLVTSVAIRTPGLVRSLYIESPYLDILRTISNPDLPLTKLENSEYGTSPINLITTAQWSPMEHIPKKGIPGLFVIARTDLTDLHVLPYEPLKFIQRIRGSNSDNGLPKLIYIHNGRGHFTTTFKSRAEDLALLESSGARIKNLGYKYKMAVSRKNRNMTRKNRDRKNRNRKNRANTVGGRRRRH